MTDLQQELSDSLNLDDLDLGPLGEEEIVEGNIRLDLNEEASQEGGRDALSKMALFSRIPVTMTLEVASVDISLADLMSINQDSVVELDKLAGEPLDIKVNGILFGKAEVVVLNDKYGLRIIEFNSKELGELTS